MVKGITSLQVSGFRSLEDVDVPLGPMTVLVGPNGSGKTNVLNVLRFLATTVRFDLEAALERWGGYDRVLRQSDPPARQVKIGVKGQITQHARPTSPDVYSLEVSLTRASRIRRSETFEFKRYRGPGRKITVSGAKFHISGDKTLTRSLASQDATGLATLPRLGDDEGGEGIRTFAEFLSTIRVLEPNVEAARQPGRLVPASISEDASNLSSALLHLKEQAPDRFEDLQHDVRQILPGLERIHFQALAGSAQGVVVQLVETGLNRRVDLADASFGTVRGLAILAALHDPDPPPMTAIEEIDHGLHPYALDILIDRMRATSARTQLLLTTHSPTLVNRLTADELIVCHRDARSGASVIPALAKEEMKAALDSTDLGLGELWFAGAIEGIPA
jgi:predicted ATPase